jgi:hypothetical protein
MKLSSKKQYPDVKINATINNDMKDYGNDPYFIKKDKESQAFLKKNGFPEELLKIRKGYL